MTKVDFVLSNVWWRGPIPFSKINVYSNVPKIQQRKFTAWNQFGTGKTNVLKCDHKDPVDNTQKKKKEEKTYQSGGEAKGKSLFRPPFFPFLSSSYFFFFPFRFRAFFCVACCAWVHFLDVGNYHIFGFCLLSLGEFVIRKILVKKNIKTTHFVELKR